METLRLEIVTPNGAIFSGDVSSVTLPGKDGEFGVLPGHASLVTLLEHGVIEIANKEGDESIVIDEGHVKIDEGKVIVLAEGAVAIEGGSSSSIAQSLEKAKELLENAKATSSVIADVEAKIEKMGHV